MPGILKPLLAEPAKHLLNLWRQPNYYEYHRLCAQFRGTPRHQPVTLHIGDWHLRAPDAASFLSTYRDLFVNRIYAFDFPGRSPNILDLGANIGLSVLCFKQQFPDARIVAMEADPMIFGYLESNIRQNGIDGVKLLNQAAWYESTTLLFQPDQADAGRVRNTPGSQTIEIKALNVSEFLAKEDYDFIKMDIEGAESVVLPACAPYLDRVGYIFVEYHSYAGQPQHFAEIISLLEKAGFRLSLDKVWGSQSPLLERKVSAAGMDFQTNIFGWREQ